MTQCTNLTCVNCRQQHDDDGSYTLLNKKDSRRHFITKFVLVETDGCLVSPATLLSRRRKGSIVITMMRKCPERRNIVLSFT